MKHGAVLVCWVLVCSVLAYAVPNRTTSQDRLAAWVRAIDQHQPGAVDEHVSTLATWTAAELNDVLAHAFRAEVSSLGTRLKRAAWLHTDIAILHRNRAGYGVAATGAASAIVGDGQLAGTLRRTPHWAFARRLIHESRRMVAADVRRTTGREVPPDESVRVWYRAGTAFLQSWNEYVELGQHLSDALAAFPADPVLLLIKGSMHEYFAEPQIQVALEQLRRENVDVASVRTPTAERQEALRALTAALRADPTLVEARIRRANVLFRLGRYREVIDEVFPLLDGPPPGALGYWLQLVHGRTLFALDQPKGARSAFAAAVALFPGAQTPRMGLAQAAMRLGDAVEPETLALRIGYESDPWLSYHQTHVPHADALVGLMRERWPR